MYVNGHSEFGERCDLYGVFLQWKFCRNSGCAREKKFDKCDCILVRWDLDSCKFGHNGIKCDCFCGLYLENGVCPQGHNGKKCG